MMLGRSTDPLARQPGRAKTGDDCLELMMSQAKDLLDVAISQDLLFMESYESAVMSDPMYARQRARSVAMVKAEWLERPPFALEDGTKSYIEEVCRQTKGCPTGDIHQRPSSEEPKKGQ